MTGTKRIVELAHLAQKCGQLQRLAYLSTAYVCGNRSGVIQEHELYRDQQFDNSYQQSQYESEQLLMTQILQLPVTIFRPSIIVGHSKTGRTSAFNVIYYPLKLIYRGILKFIPGSPDTPLDIVPVDYVCAAIQHILLQSDRGIGETFHLTTGPEDTSTVGEIIDKAVNYFKNTLPDGNIALPKFVFPKFYRLAEFFSVCRNKEFLKKFESYIPLLNSVKIFDNCNTLTELSSTSVQVPSFHSYINRILQYCIDVDWGRKDLSWA